MELDPTICERARISRDPRFDGRFFIGVVTTGIYCRPVCTVRAPRAENVRFFPSAAAAAAAGFRPCLRCRPEAAAGSPPWLGTSVTVSRALRLIADGALDDRGVEDLAGPLGVSARHLSRLFVKHIGAPPVVVAQTRRLHFAKKLIDETDLSMADVALSSGFGSVRRFNAVFRGVYGRPPGALRKARSGRDRAAGESPIVLRLAYRPPFDWRRLLGFLAQRATPGVEAVAGGSYRRTIRIDGRAGLIEVRNRARQNVIELGVSFPDPRALFRIADGARRMFDLDADASEIARHLRADAGLAPLVRARPGLRVPGAWDAFELATRAILGQQVSVKGATTLAGRVALAFGDPLEIPDATLSRLFPGPEVLATADLSGLGLPGARAAAIGNLARAVCRGEVELDAGLPTETVVGQLTAVRGVGEWTARYIGMRALRDPDAFPATDLGLLRAAGEGGRRATAKELLERAEAWRPWRAYAAIHLWNHDGELARPAAGRGAAQQ